MRIVTRRRMTVCCAILAAMFFAAGVFGLCGRIDARAETVTPASLITAENATVTAGKPNTGATEGDGYDVTGLTVEGGAGYSATLNGVFKDDVKLDFALLSKVATDDNPQNFGGQGAFSFRIADAGDSTSYFDILLQPVNFWDTWHNVVYIKYGNEIRWRQHGANGGGGIFNTDIVADASNSLYAWAAIPMNGADGNTENSYIKLSWTGEAKDILNVSVMCGHNYNVDGQRYEIILASFDGTSALNSEAKEFGLAKLTGMKENGFIISFGSDYADETNPENDGTDICLTKLTVDTAEYDLTGTSAFASEPQWYTDYQSRATITLAEKPAAYWNKEVGAYTVPTATYTTVGNSVPQSVASVKLTDAEGTEVSIADGKATFTKDGTYTLTYTAIADSSAVGNTLSYTVNVGEYLPAANLIDGDGVTAGKPNTGANAGDGYDVTGLTVEGGAGYSATLNGVFKDDVKLDFALLSKDTSGNTNGKGHFTFTVTSTSDPDDYFEIHIVPASYNRTTIYVQYKGDYRMATDSGKYFYAKSVNDLPDIEGIANNDAYTWVKTYLAGADLPNQDSYIRLQKEGDVLSVIAVSAQSNNEYTIAKFDGETEPVENVVEPLIGGKTTYNNCCLPKLTWENGFIISFGSDYTDENDSENNGTDICLKKLTVGTKEYDLSAVVLSETGADWYDAYENIVVWNVAEGEATVPNREYTVREATYSLQDGVTTGQTPFKTEYAYLGESGEGEPSWQAIEGGKFTPTQAGVYEIRYTAVDGGANLNNTYSYRVTVRAVQQVAKPTLPAGSDVTYDGHEYTVKVAENEAYTVTGTLSATAANTYTITVSLKDKVYTEWEGDGTADITLQWTIAKATPVITAEEEQSAEYDGEAQAVTSFIEGVNGEELTVTVAWYSDAAHENALVGAPVEAGTYYAVLSYAGSENYNAAQSVNVTFTVTKVKVTAPSAPEGVTYNGQLQTAQVAENAAYTVRGNQQKNAGTYDITVALNDKNNYEWNVGTTEDIILQWTIAKVKVAAPSAPEGVTYNGQLQTAQVAENAAYTVRGNQQKNAGTYDITVALNDKDNYEWNVGTTADITLQWTIAKATPVITAEEEQSAEYDGEAQAVTSFIEGVNGEELTVTVAWYSDAAHENALVGAPVEAGTYYAVLSYAGSDNYNAAASVNVTFTVTKEHVGPSEPSGPSDPNQPSEPEEPKGLSGGEIAAIVIACVVFAGAATVLGIVLYRHKMNGTPKKK